jgi:flagellar biosynthetic protein FlhB
MALFAGNDGRTEKATPKKRNESREKGQIARSQNLPFAATFVGIVVLLKVYGPILFDDLKQMMHYQLSHASRMDFTVGDLQSLVIHLTGQIGKIVLLIMFTGLILSVAANASQGGLVISSYKLGFRFGNLNPIAGIQRLLPKTSGIELFKNLFTIGIVTHFAYSLYLGIYSELPRLMLHTPYQITLHISQVVYQLSLRSGIFLLFIAIADYFWNRRQFEQGIRMTKEEVKDEAKNAEGNPEIKGRIKRKQREIALKFIMAAVPKADVVITNPTHFAVALAYQKEKMSAPTIVAKGQDYMALRIRSLAQNHQVPIVENKPLAQTLYKTVEVGQQIPGELYKAVAEVLAYVYKLKMMRL